MKMVFYVKIFLDTPYFGTKGEEVYKYEADTPEELKKIIEIDYENAVRQHAEQYEHNAYGWDDVPTSDEALEEYYDDCFSYSSWEFITKEEFEKLL
jgi:hypothetical protein